MLRRLARSYSCQRPTWLGRRRLCQSFPQRTHSLHNQARTQCLVNTNTDLNCSLLNTDRQHRTDSSDSGTNQSSQHGRFGPAAAGALFSAVAVAIVRNDIFWNSEGEAEQLIRSAAINDVVGLKRMLGSGLVDVNARHILGWTALHVAAFHGCTELGTVELLIEAGAKVDLSDEFTSVQKTAVEKGLNMLEVQFYREGDFGSRLRFTSNFSGCTPLHYAVLGDNVATVQCLLKAGADPTACNAAGHTPQDYAKTSTMHTALKYASDKFIESRKKREAEERRRYPLEKRIKEKIVGQESAIATVAATIRRKENGWIDDEHPLVFLFLGSSGIGKTELAKQVANYMYRDDCKNFIRLDMSEYQQKHEVSKFIGSPPGYVGHEDGGQLTKRLTETPDAVVLFDEIEKAHPDILTILLQLFDEGRLTDGKGKTVECKNAIFIMTSNLASDEIASYSERLRDEASKINQGKMSGTLEDVNAADRIAVSKQFKERVVQPILKRHFKRDEFLGRINEMVYFVPFSQSELAALVKRELEGWRDRAARRHRIALEWDAAVVDVLAAGYNLRYGARSIKHEVERRVVNKLAAAHERELLLDGSRVRLVAVLPAASTSQQQSDEDDDSASAAPSDVENAAIELEVTATEGGKADRLVIPDTHLSEMSSF